MTRTLKQREGWRGVLTVAEEEKTRVENIGEGIVERSRTKISVENLPGRGRRNRGRGNFFRN